MNRPLLSAGLIALASLILLPSLAHAGRKVRLMYEPPIAAEGGPEVVVSFENQRPAKKGGTEPDLIGQERGSYGIPVGIFSGKQKTEHADVVVAGWAADVLRSAGYAASITENPELPRVHVRLNQLWGDGFGPRLQFTFGAVIEVWPVGATEPAWTKSVAVTSGVTTIVQFHDPYELGFKRVFELGAKSFLAEIASDDFQAALPGGNLEAAASAAAILGDREATAQAAEAAREEDASGDGAEGEASGDGGAAAAAELPPGFKTWDPDVYRWGGKSTIGSYVMGGVGVGLLIGGDQWARATANNYRGLSLPVVGSTFQSVAHIPDSGPDDIDVGNAVQGLASELIFIYGLQTVVPVFGAVVPGHIVAATGVDIQTAKAFGGIVSLPAIAPAGITHLVRFGQLYVPQLQQENADGDNERILHVPMAVVSLAAGIADLVIGGIQFGYGIAYATDKITADPDERGIIPSPQMQEGRMRNTGAIHFIVAPTTDGGVAFGLYGTF